MDHINDNLFQVSVKGMFFNKDNNLMMMKQENGIWDLPGGRIQKGEDLIESLKRECFEEMGLECLILERQPSIVYSAIDQKGRPRIMICYKISFSNLDFKPSAECVEIKFCSKEEIRQLKTNPQTKKLPDYL